MPELPRSLSQIADARELTIVAAFTDRISRNSRSGHVSIWRFEREMTRTYADIRPTPGSATASLGGKYRFSGNYGARMAIIAALRQDIHDPESLRQGKDERAKGAIRHLAAMAGDVTAQLAAEQTIEGLSAPRDTDFDPAFGLRLLGQAALTRIESAPDQQS